MQCAALQWLATKSLLPPLSHTPPSAFLDSTTTPQAEKSYAEVQIDELREQLAAAVRQAMGVPQPQQQQQPPGDSPQLQELQAKLASLQQQNNKLASDLITARDQVTRLEATRERTEQKMSDRLAAMEYEYSQKVAEASGGVQGLKRAKEQASQALQVAQEHFRVRLGEAEAKVGTLVSCLSGLRSGLASMLLLLCW